jgi:hypothetical protein
MPEPGVVTVKRGREASFIEVRGKPGYETNHDDSDPLHAFLDALDPTTVSMLFAGDVATLNPRNPRHAPSFEACDRLYERGWPLN